MWRRAACFGGGLGVGFGVGWGLWGRVEPMRRIGWNWDQFQVVEREDCNVPLFRTEEGMLYMERGEEGLVVEALETHRVVVVVGPANVGKTTLVAAALGRWGWEGDWVKRGDEIREGGGSVLVVDSGENTTELTGSEIDALLSSDKEKIVLIGRGCVFENAEKLNEGTIWIRVGDLPEAERKLFVEEVGREDMAEEGSDGEEEGGRDLGGRIGDIVGGSGPGWLDGEVEKAWGQVGVVERIATQEFVDEIVKGEDSGDVLEIVGGLEEVIMEQMVADALEQLWAPVTPQQEQLPQRSLLPVDKAADGDDVVLDAASKVESSGIHVQYPIDGEALIQSCILRSLQPRSSCVSARSKLLERGLLERHPSIATTPRIIKPTPSTTHTLQPPLRRIPVLGFPPDEEEGESRGCWAMRPSVVASFPKQEPLTKAASRHAIQDAIAWRNDADTLAAEAAALLRGHETIAALIRKEALSPAAQNEAEIELLLRQESIASQAEQLLFRQKHILPSLPPTLRPFLKHRPLVVVHPYELTSGTPITTSNRDSVVVLPAQTIPTANDDEIAVSRAAADASDTHNTLSKTLLRLLEQETPNKQSKHPINP